MNYTKGATVKFALKQSLPVLFGYLFLGSAFGIMLYKAGYNWLWAIFICRFRAVFACVVNQRKSGYRNDCAYDFIYKHTPYVLRLIVYRKIQSGKMALSFYDFYAD